MSCPRWAGSFLFPFRLVVLWAIWCLGRLFGRRILFRLGRLFSFFLGRLLRFLVFVGLDCRIACLVGFWIFRFLFLGFGCWGLLVRNWIGLEILCWRYLDFAGFHFLENWMVIYNFDRLENLFVINGFWHFQKKTHHLQFHR